MNIFLGCLDSQLGFHNNNIQKQPNISCLHVGSGINISKKPRFDQPREPPGFWPGIKSHHFHFPEPFGAPCPGDVFFDFVFGSLLSLKDILGDIFGLKLQFVG